MKFIIIALLTILCLNIHAQRNGRPVYLPNDTLKGQDTVIIELPIMTGFHVISWEIYFKEIGGTSDGVGYLEGANDTLYAIINDIEGVVKSIPNDTIEISDNLKTTYWIYGNPYNNHRVRLIGTAGDTTAIFSNYIRK